MTFWTTKVLPQYPKTTLLSETLFLVFSAVMWSVYKFELFGHVESWAIDFGLGAFTILVVQQAIRTGMIIRTLRRNRKVVPTE